MQKSVFGISDTPLSEFDSGLQDNFIEAAIIGLPLGIQQRSKKENITNQLRLMTNDPKNVFLSNQAPHWFYDHEEGSHIIFIPYKQGFDSLTNNNKTNIQRSLLTDLYHEYGHALFTSVDLKSIGEICKKSNVPFDMVNIFEDMRIEHLISTHFLQGLSLHDHCEVPDDMRIKPIESSDSFFSVLLKTLGSQGNVEPYAFANPHYLTIKEYYTRAIFCNSTDEIVELSIEFYNKYKDLLQELAKKEQPKNNDKKKEEKTVSIAIGSHADFKSALLKDDDDAGPSEQLSLSLSQNGKGSIELVFSSDMLMSDELRKVILLEAKEIKITSRKNPSKEAEINMDSSPNPKTENNISIKAESNSEALIDLKTTKKPLVSSKFIEETQKICDRLKELLIPHKKAVSNYYSGDVLVDNVIALSTKTDIELPLYENNQNNFSKMASLHIIVDLSGSMQGLPTKNVQKILFALNELSASYELDVKVTFSKVSNGNIGLYQTVSFPINYKSLFTISADGSSEGLSNACKNSIQEDALKKDFIFFFTDGKLSEKDASDIIKLFKNNPSLGEKSIGVYLDNIEHANIELFTTMFGSNYIACQNTVDTVLKIVEIAQNGLANNFSSKNSRIKLLKP